MFFLRWLLFVDKSSHKKSADKKMKWQKYLYSFHCTTINKVQMISSFIFLTYIFLSSPLVRYLELITKLSRKNLYDRKMYGRKIFSCLFNKRTEFG